MSNGPFLPDKKIEARKRGSSSQRSFTLFAPYSGVVHS